MMRISTPFLLLLLLSGQQLFSQSITEFIVVDQFGYRPVGEKIAVIRNPQEGPDAQKSFSPSTNFALVDATNGNHVFTSNIQEWNGGAVDASSGDQAWWFDFSEVEEAGRYYVLDPSNNLRSYEFSIDEQIYNQVLQQAVRTFFYQRSGFVKEAPYAGEGWADGASHLGPLQDSQCRSFDDPNNATTEKDLHGGWYDAGDFNKYSSWTADYVIDLFKAYEERPEIWGDDYGIPESGNGRPDIIDEALWGLEYLERLQQPDGSVISIVAVAQGSPPSVANGQSLYGHVNTSSALSVGSAYAKSALVLKDFGMESKVMALTANAEKAWDWANDNPDVIWKNNDEAYGSKGIGGGQQEVDDYGRLFYKMRLALYLFELTGKTAYRDFFDANYSEIHLMKWNFAYPFEGREQELLLHYTQVPNHTNEVAEEIKSVYVTAMQGPHNFGAVQDVKDPYLAYLKDYTWGSNSKKCVKGLMFYGLHSYELDPSNKDASLQVAEHYIHYLHGVNPLSKAYLSNMGAFGAENSVNQFYHGWFHQGSALWDEVGVSTYGPAPAFLVGGPNPKYDWDDCCPNNCGSATNNAKCQAVDISVIVGQPDQKSYMDFNHSWPINSWEVTENSCNYQVNYIRLLSKFVEPNEILTGNTSPQTDSQQLYVYPNPSHSQVVIEGTEDLSWTLYHVTGEEVASGTGQQINIQALPTGVYYLKNGDETVRFVKR